LVIVAPNSYPHKKQKKSSNGQASRQTQVHHHQQICQFYPIPGCRFGSGCKFAHINQNSSQGKVLESMKRPHDPQNNQNNQRGGHNNREQQRCQPENYQGRQAGENQFSNDIINFLRQIRESLQKNSPFIISSGNERIWYESFDAVAKTGGDGTNLLEMYLKITNNQGTPKAENVLKILILFLLRNPTPAKMGLAHSIVENRLLREASQRTIQDKPTLLTLIDELDKARKKAKSEFVKKEMDEEDYEECDKMLRDIVKKYKSEVENWEVVPEDDITAVSSSNPLPPSHGWISSPTLGWLLDEAWMHTKDFKDVYESLDHYVATMQETWTLLTFYWGAAAFWPKCCSSEGGNNAMCNQPLLHLVSSRSSTQHGYKCKRCPAPAKWRCFRSNHDAICDKCLKSGQDGLLGPSGVHGSTDVYDSLIQSVTISSENRIIHCGKLRSRKPPQTPINWKTSYRLQCDHMVAIIPVSVENSQLSRSDILFWGEVVRKSHKESNSEHVRRGKEEISIRIMGKNDCDLFHDIDEHKFNLGKRIVVVDMRVFIPEVISVLATLASGTFKNGLKRVSFQQLLLDSTNADNMQISPSSNDLSELIYYSVRNSAISAVKKLSEEDKLEIFKMIWDIPQVRTLDDTQGKAFSSALLQSMHTVQGPPGSGKVGNN
jgi:hypothetical protein